MVVRGRHSSRNCPGAGRSKTTSPTVQGSRGARRCREVSHTPLRGMGAPGAAYFRNLQKPSSRLQTVYPDVPLEGAVPTGEFSV